MQYRRLAQLRQSLYSIALVGAVFMLSSCDSGGDADKSASKTEAAPAVASNPQEEKLRAAVVWAQKLINSTAFNDMAAESLASMAESGGDITTFILSSVPDGGFTCYSGKPEARALCVRVSPSGSEGEYLLEGFGESTDKPIIQVTAKAVWPQ